MEYLFSLTYDFLKKIEQLTGLSYEEVNCILWFFLIPFSWAFLIDRILKKHLFKILFISTTTALLLIIENPKSFATWLFSESVHFLNLFNSMGSNYTTSSVIFCLFIPIIIYVVLIRKAFFK